MEKLQQILGFIPGFLKKSEPIVKSNELPVVLNTGNIDFINQDTRSLHKRSTWITVSDIDTVKINIDPIRTKKYRRLFTLSPFLEEVGLSRKEADVVQLLSLFYAYSTGIICGLKLDYGLLSSLALSISVFGGTVLLGAGICIAIQSKQANQGKATGKNKTLHV